MAKHTKPTPCVFCKELPVIERWHGGGRNKHRVYCMDELCLINPSLTGSTRAKAEQLWNIAMSSALSKASGRAPTNKEE